MSNNLRSLRKARGLTLWGLATRIGSSPATLHAIERYGHVPQPPLQQAIADGLGVRVRDIWPGQDEDVRRQLLPDD